LLVLVIVGDRGFFLIDSGILSDGDALYFLKERKAFFAF
jgi:hypothetical protein